jgi:hypothetical protein
VQLDLAVTASSLMTDGRQLSRAWPASKRRTERPLKQVTKPTGLASGWLYFLFIQVSYVIVSIYPQVFQGENPRREGVNR